MTISQLIEKLQEYDPNMFVSINTEYGEIDVINVKTTTGLVSRNGEWTKEEYIVIEHDKI